MAGPKVRRDICDAVARSFTVQFEPGVVVRPRPKPSCLRRHRTLVQTVLQVQAQMAMPPPVRWGGLVRRAAGVVVRPRPKLCCLRRHRLPLCSGSQIVCRRSRSRQLLLSMQPSHVAPRVGLNLGGHAVVPCPSARCRGNSQIAQLNLYGGNNRK